MFTGRLDVAPFASVFFLLVIFLVLLSHLAPAPGVSVLLPQADLPEAGIGPDGVVVIMDAEGRLYLNQQITTEKRLRDELPSKLRAAGNSRVLVLQASAGVRIQDLVRFYALCRQLGIEEVKLQTRPSPLLGGGAAVWR